MIYLVSLVIHVVSAVLGVGQVLALAFASRPAQPDVALLRTLALTTRWSLLLVLLSGIAMMWVTHGVYAHALWFRASFAGFVIIGGLTGAVFRALKAGAFARVRGLAFAMTGLVGVVVALMEAKP